MADTGEEQPSALERVRQSPRRWILGLLLVVAIYAIGLVAVGIEDALAAFSRASILPLVVALLLQAAVVVLWGLIYRSSVLAANGSIGVRGALRVSMPTFTLSRTLPGGGWAGNALAVQRMVAQGMTGPGATAAAALAATISLATISLLGAVGIVVAFAAGDLSTTALLVAIPALLIVIAVVVTTVVTLRSPSTGDRVVGWLGRLHRRLGEHVGEWRDSLREVTEDPPTRGQLARITGWALLKWSADIASLALVFVALGATPRISALLVGFGVIQLATAIPATPGAVGFVEGGMVAAFITLGYAAALATSVVVVYRVLSTWLPVLAGVPLLLRQPDPEDDPLA